MRVFIIEIKACLDVKIQCYTDSLICGYLYVFIEWISPNIWWLMSCYVKICVISSWVITIASVGDETLHWFANLNVVMSVPLCWCR